MKFNHVHAFISHTGGVGSSIGYIQCLEFDCYKNLSPESYPNLSHSPKLMVVQEADPPKNSMNRAVIKLLTGNAAYQETGTRKPVMIIESERGETLAVIGLSMLDRIVHDLRGNQPDGIEEQGFWVSWIGPQNIGPAGLDEKGDQTFP